MSGEAIEQLKQRIIDHALDVALLGADLTTTRTQDGASRRTNTLVDGISHTQPAYDGNLIMCDIISAADYSEFQNRGTGIYGPFAERIFPTSAKALRFDWPAAGGIVFAKSVAGSPGTHFWDNMDERWHDALAESIGG